MKTKLGRGSFAAAAPRSSAGSEGPPGIGPAVIDVDTQARARARSIIMAMIMVSDTRRQVHVRRSDLHVGCSAARGVEFHACSDHHPAYELITIRSLECAPQLPPFGYLYASVVTAVVIFGSANDESFISANDESFKEFY